MLITALMTELQRLFRCIHPYEAGAHCIVWPAFVGAAEAQGEADRRFFTDALTRLYETTGYRNVSCALAALPLIWENCLHQRWTATLPQVGTLIM